MFTLARLVRRNLAYHWRGNLAVMLGVAVGSAVLTGALLVGDSLRGSLRARVERQLGGIDAAALFPRPLRADIADGMPGRTAPVLLLPGSLQVATGDDASAPFLGRITVLGIDARYPLAGAETAIDWNGSKRAIVVSARVAAKLGLKAGDRVKLGVERFSAIPRATLLAKRSLDDSSAVLTLTVAAILPPDAPGNDFNLTPNPAAPLNVFVPLRTLSDLVQDAPGEAPRVTALLSAGAGAEELNRALRSRLTAADLGFQLQVPLRPAGWMWWEPRGHVSIETEQLVMGDALAASVEAIAAKLGMRAERTIVYLVNAITHGRAEIPYSIVAAVNPNAPPPLGPFHPAPGDNEIVLIDWPESPLRSIPTDGSEQLTLTYYNPAIEGEGRIETQSLRFRGYIPFSGAADDRTLTPTVKGLTDQGANPRDWDRPPQLTNSKVREKIKSGDVHDQYWNRYRATPKAYVNLATGARLFASRYGAVTSIRVAPAPGQTAFEAARQLRAALAAEVDPKTAGIVFEPVRDRLLTASTGGTDFGGLFLGFSFFLIAAALVLVGLLFRLALDRRAKEVGLLLAAGFRHRTVRRLLLIEGFALAAIGSLAGLALGVAYNRLLLALLLDLWPDRDAAAVLQPHARPASFAFGFGSSLVMALGALWLSLRGLVKVPPPALLRGETAAAATAQDRRSRGALWLALGCGPLGIALVAAGKFATNPDLQAMTFFAGGGFLLASGLAAMWGWMKRRRHATVNGRGLPALANLGARNAARNPARSLLTAALLASAAFLLVAVESFRRQPGTDFLSRTGGSGGFNLIAEADVPVFQPFDAGPGRADLEDRIQSAYGGTSTDPRFLAAAAELKTIEVIPLRLRDGDDASCLNLFQAARPRVLGVPDALIDRGGFHFYATEAATPDEIANPWLLLRKPLPGGAIPVFCEQNTAQWMLKKSVGDTVTMPGDDGRPLTLRIAGTFADSPFQSELVMADESFTRSFPATGGYRVFLITTPPGQEEAIGRVLALGLRANGLIATPTRERVAAYQAVIGAYLSTFQLLGGLGLLLGVLGLAVVVLRGVWERIGELALLRAVGYRTRQLQFLVLAENALLLSAGLVVGVAAALVSVAPHVAAGAAVPWPRLAAILAVVFALGLAASSVAAAAILRVPLIPALRRE